MKKINFTLAFLLLVCILNAQYKVTKVAGRIQTGAGKYIKPGSELNDNDLLVFSTPVDKLWVIIPGSGEKVISPSAQAQPAGKGVSQLLKDANISDAKAISVRAAVDIFERIPQAITSENPATDKTIIEPVNKFLFDKTEYPQSEDSSFFFLQIDVPSKKPITRRLAVMGDTLVINYTDFLTESDNPGNKYQLGFYNKAAISRVALISPYFDLTNEMEDVIAGTVKTYKKENMSKDSLWLKTYNIVYSTSGKPNGLLFSFLFTKYWQGNIADTQTVKPAGLGNNYNETDFISTPVLSHLVSTTRDSMPSNFSLRQYAPPIGYQGTYSTCVAWATAYAVRTIAFAVRNNYTIQENNDKIISNTFSPEFLYNNVQPGGCDRGTSLPRCLRFICQNGDVVAKDNNFICGRAYMNYDFEKAKAYRLKDFQRVNDFQNNIGEAETIGKVKALLYNRHAIAFSMDIYDSFLKTDASGVWYPVENDIKTADSVRKRLLPHQNGHAMCLIGYNDQVAGGSFEIMNSWGKFSGHNGFYWINYHDFYSFANEMYTVSDYDDTDIHSMDTVITVKNKDTLKPAPIVIKPNEVSPVVIQQDTRPRIKGDIEFMKQTVGGGFESIGVTRLTDSSNNNAVANADTAKNTTYYNLVKPLYSGNRYRIKFNLAQSAYVYVIGKGSDNKYYRLFPDSASHESPLINFSDATLSLPNMRAFYKLDSVTGKENMCLLFSKSPIDINTLDSQLTATNTDIYKSVNNNFSSRLVDLSKPVVENANNNKLYFDTLVTDDKVLALFIKIDHL